MGIGTVHGRFRVTEQGEMITQNLGQVSILCYYVIMLLCYYAIIYYAIYTTIYTNTLYILLYNLGQEAVAERTLDLFTGGVLTEVCVCYVL
jgi:phosphoenolpyruvate carboxylase